MATDAPNDYADPLIQARAALKLYEEAVCGSDWASAAEHALAVARSAVMLESWAVNRILAS